MTIELTGIGLMSGTSADGINAALVRLKTNNDDRLEVKVLDFIRLGFDTKTKQQVLASFNCYTAKELCELNFQLGEKFAMAANELKGKYPKEIDFVASHGQTIYHIPPNQGLTPSTLQLGEPCVIAERTGLTVVADFRTRDIAAGGEGAPLVALADYLLFNHLGGVIVQNIGGIANLTYVPCDRDQNKVIAFDTGPGNMIIDEVVRIVTYGKEEYDQSGQRAKNGKVHYGYLEFLLEEPYFSLYPPKTTGRELFGKQYAKRFVERGEFLELNDNDLVATATALTVESIARAYERYVLPQKDIAYVIVGGGGSYNTTLMEWLRKRLPFLIIKTHEDVGISSDAKEAIAFSILGYRTLYNLPGNVPSATGSSNSCVLGKIIPGNNFRRLINKIYCNK